MGRPVLLSFDGAAAIPIVPYVKTRDRVAEIPAIPGTPGDEATPGHPGFDEGVAAEWIITTNTDEVDDDADIFPDDYLRSGEFSVRMGVDQGGDRTWAYSANLRHTVESLWRRGNYVSIALHHQDRQGNNRREGIATTLAQGKEVSILLTGMPLDIPGGIVLKYVCGVLREGPDYTEVFIAFHSVEYSHGGTAVLTIDQLETTIEALPGTPELNAGFPARIAIPGTGIGGFSEGTPQQDFFTYYNGLDHDSTPPLTFAQWSSDSNGNGTLDDATDLVIQTRQGALFKFYIPIAFSPEFGIYPILLYSTDSPGWEIHAEGTISASGVVFRTLNLTINDNPTITGPNGSLINPTANWVTNVVLRINYLIPGIPGDPIPPAPEVPRTGYTPGTPDILGVPGIPGTNAIYEDAMYGRPAIPAFGVWGERLSMNMTHRVENELEVIDIQISGHDYIIRQEWVTPKDHRVRPFCWIKDERGIVQTVETVDQSDEKTTRFSTMAIVNGPANAIAVPLPADFQEGDTVVEPSFRVQPEVVNHVLVVHDDIDPQPESIIMEVQVRVGWALTSFAVEKVLTRDNNHPADGAVLTTIDTPFRTPPYPPALATENSLYLHIWVSGLIDPLSFLLGGANQISGWTKIGRLVVDGVSGALYVSDHLLSEAINQFDFEVRLTNA